ncbi:MAG TPA: CBS domain-containing protein [Actinoplanes sp.]|nr:CBS domain-containing protein [Actinoplanes sp.]
MGTWQVDDVMTRTVVTAAEDTPYRELVDLVVGQKVSAVPVVDSFRRVVGLVSEADLLRKVEYAGADGPPRLFERRRRRSDQVKATGRTAADLMTAPAVTAMTGTTVTAAARLMHDASVKRLPIVDDLGRLVGLVSRSDLLKVHTRPDADIHRDIVTDIFRRVLTIGEHEVQVRVDGGVVTLGGRLDRRSTVDIAVRLVRQVAGVMDVVSRLDYEFDDSHLVRS